MPPSLTATSIKPLQPRSLINTHLRTHTNPLWLWESYTPMPLGLGKALSASPSWAFHCPLIHPQGIKWAPMCALSASSSSLWLLPCWYKTSCSAHWAWCFSLLRQTEKSLSEMSLYKKRLATVKRANTTYEYFVLRILCVSGLLQQGRGEYKTKF